MEGPQYPIETDRLLLRPLRPSDAPALHAYQSREDVCRYIPYEPRSLADLRQRLSTPQFTRSEADEPGQAIMLAVERSTDHVLVGDLMLAWTSKEHQGGEIGYVFNPDHQGHGYATEAAKALLRLGFETLGLRRIIARVDARNTASAAVLRRIGMRQEAYLVQNEWFKGEWTDEIDFAILRDEWRQANA
ncbi:MAG TPA: GNAT family N-acetyltransferase [Jatrophihabitans sp.]|jgi:RimJ/RimL family protein N-acetyltransferase